MWRYVCLVYVSMYMSVSCGEVKLSVPVSVRITSVFSLSVVVTVGGALFPPLKNTPQKMSSKYRYCSPLSSSPSTAPITFTPSIFSLS